MEGRCSVETWAEFGHLGKSGTAKVKFGFGTNVYIGTGSDEVYVFSANEKNLTTILQLPFPVCDLVESSDRQRLFVACKNGVYCINLQLLSHRYQRSSGDASSSPAEVKISSEFLVVEGDGVSSLLLVGPVLLTLYQTDTSWLLSLYKLPQKTQSHYEVLSSFSLPLISPAVQEEAKLTAGKIRKSVLICVHCGDGIHSSSPEETDASYPYAHLEPVLFKLLFGVEAALVKSPVILCGLPDGRLCFLPLRLPGSRLRVLHSLEQPVMFVGASIVTETDPGHARCLVAVGEQGRVVLIRTERVGPERGGNLARFTEGFVSGPVMCGFVDKNCLYYSTGSDLLTLSLSEGSAGRGEKEMDEEVLQSPTSLDVFGVIALNEPKNRTAGEVKLLGLSIKGQLQSIKLPGWRRQGEFSKLPTSQVGRSVRDLLSGIGDVCERASVLKTIIKSKNQTLRQLNHVLNISFLLTAGRKTEELFPAEAKPITCRATASWSRLLQKDSFHLTCVLDNSSPYVLERGWTLSIAVCPLSCSSNTKEETSFQNFSIPFHSLGPGESLEVTLPVAGASDASFPLTVNCLLIFSLSSFLGEEEEALSSPGVKNSCFSLPLNTLTVDWLHALDVNSSTSTHKVATFRSNMTDTIQAFLSLRQTRCSGEDGALTPEKYSARVAFSSELLKDALMLKKAKGCDLNSKRAELSPLNLCISLLDWLLFEDHGGVKMGQKSDKIQTSSLVIHGHAPNGATVKITAKEVNEEEENRGMEEEECRVSVEVQIESPSIAAVCGLHHAVLLRIQPLLEKVPGEAASTQKVQSLGLRRALRRAEILQTQISKALSVGVSSGQTNRFLLGVYQELRENPVLII